jgi:hypothetical protein
VNGLLLHRNLGFSFYKYTGRKHRTRGEKKRKKVGRRKGKASWIILKKKKKKHEEIKVWYLPTQDSSGGAETLTTVEPLNPSLGTNGYKEDSREFDPLTQVKLFSPEVPVGSGLFCRIRIQNFYR